MYWLGRWFLRQDPKNKKEKGMQTARKENLRPWDWKKKKKLRGQSLLDAPGASRILVEEKVKWQKPKLEKQTDPNHSMEFVFCSMCNRNLCKNYKIDT